MEKYDTNNQIYASKKTIPKPSISSFIEVTGIRNISDNRIPPDFFET